jgi:hypothetical protein
VTFDIMTSAGVEDYGLAGDTYPGTGICETCHTDTNVFTSGGDGRSGEHDDKLGACVSCHPHTDGFKGGGSCVGCHGAVKGGDRRQVVGTGGDFERTSHHVGTGAESVTDADCEVCHEQGSHQAQSEGTYGVLLNDPDSSADITYDGTGGSIESFCEGCHDADGYAVTGLNPFSDDVTPTNVATNWTDNPHNNAVTLSEACMGCHGGYDSTRTGPEPDYQQNAHGSAQGDLFSARVDAEAPTNYEEGFCYTCHDTDGPAVSNVEGDFGLNTHHLVDDGEQTPDGRDAECYVCHGNLHDIVATPARTNSNAASGLIASAGGVNSSGTYVSSITYEYELCFLCHGSYAGHGGADDPGEGGAGSPDIAVLFTGTGDSDPDDAGPPSAPYDTSHPVLNVNDNANCNVDTMNTPWNQGTDEHNTMWCTDCHRTSDTVNTPHGFDTSSDSTMTVWGGLTTVTSGNYTWTPLCIKCHKSTVYVDGGAGSKFAHHATKNHKTSDGCGACHYGAVGSMVGVHGASHNQWFMTGTEFSGWTPLGRTGADDWGTCVVPCKHTGSGRDY